MELYGHSSKTLSDGIASVAPLDETLRYLISQDHMVQLYKKSLCVHLDKITRQLNANYKNEGEWISDWCHG